jgi:hypothetical protein
MASAPKAPEFRFIGMKRANLVRGMVAGVLGVGLVVGSGAAAQADTLAVTLRGPVDTNSNNASAELSALTSECSEQYQGTVIGWASWNSPNGHYQVSVVCSYGGGARR